MDLDVLGKLMVEQGIVIRAIPHETTSTYEARHAKDYPNGVVYFDPKYGREFVKVTKTNSQGGKFIVGKKQNQYSTIHIWDFGKPIVYYDTLTEAVDSLQPK